MEADLTKGDKIGIGVGGSAALGLAGYWYVSFQAGKPSEVAYLTLWADNSLYLALFAKKRLLHPAESEEFGPASSPQNETVPSSSERVLSKSPEIQHVELPLPKKITIWAPRGHYLIGGSFASILSCDKPNE